MTAVIFTNLTLLWQPRYVEGVVSESEGAWQLSNQIGGLDWDHMTRNRPFVFFRVRS